MFAAQAQAQDEEAVPLQQPEPEQLEAVPPAEEEAAPPAAAVAEAAVEEKAPPAAVAEAAVEEEPAAAAVAAFEEGCFFCTNVFGNYIRHRSEIINVREKKKRKRGGRRKFASIWEHLSDFWSC